MGLPFSKEAGEIRLENSLGLLEECEEIGRWLDLQTVGQDALSLDYPKTGFDVASRLIDLLVDRHRWSSLSELTERDWRSQSPVDAEVRAGDGTIVRPKAVVHQPDHSTPQDHSAAAL